MLTLGIVLSRMGLACVAISGYVLLRTIFVSDAELNLLAELPIEQSTSHMTGETTRKNLPVAVTDVDKLNDYRARYIEARKTERRNGRIGLWLLIGGSALQLAGLISSALSTCAH